MTRADLFAAVRPFAPNLRFDPDDVTAIDKLADKWGMPRIMPQRGALVPSTAAINLIKQFEGCRLSAYPDPGSGGDPWTIGWGATGPGIKKGVTWTQQQADERLVVDVTRFGQGVATAVGDAPTSQAQYDAFVSFAYNVGIQAFTDSTLLRMHTAGNLVGAASQFARWNKAGGQVLNGLTRRRAAEAALYRGNA